MKYIVIDIDHTISDAAVRDHLISSADMDWDAYHAASINDNPCLDTIEILDLIAFADKRYSLIGLTTRPEKWRSLTNLWLLRNGVHLDELIMRPDDDYSPSPELKVKLISQFIGNDWKSSIQCVFEDNEKNVAAFKAQGVTVFQVHNRRYDNESR